MSEYNVGDTIRVTTKYPNPYYWGETGTVVAVPEQGEYPVRVQLINHPIDGWGWMLRAEEVEPWG